MHGVDTVWDGVDLEIRYGTCSQSGLTSVPLMPDRLFPVCDRTTAERLHSPCDLLQERLIHVIGNSHGWSEWLEAAGVTPPRGGLSTQTDTSAVALALAASGAGVALGHASLLGDFAAGRRLVQPFDLGIENEWSLPPRLGERTRDTARAGPLRKMACRGSGERSRYWLPLPGLTAHAISSASRKSSPKRMCRSGAMPREQQTMSSCSNKSSAGPLSTMIAA